MSPLVVLFVACAIFVLWHFLPQKKTEAPKPAPRYRNDFRVSAGEAEWQAFVEEHCESPAEIAFLRAMITSLGMQPYLGALVSEGIRLDFQVEEGRYRVDFLVNHWLVVEIDGAAYHSSAEAKARDQMRDRYFEGLGYTVLRVPAKVVFQTPDRAVEEVQSALELGKRKIENPPSDPQPTSGFARLANAIAAFGEVDELASKRHAIRLAATASDLAMEAEEKALASAFQLANERMDHALWLKGISDDVRACYEQSVADLGAVVGAGPEVLIPVAQSNFERPASTGDEWVDAKISECFDRQAARRAALFQSTKIRLAENDRVRSHMRDALTDLGRGDLWAHVS